MGSSGDFTEGQNIGCPIEMGKVVVEGSGEKRNLQGVREGGLKGSRDGYCFLPLDEG